MAKSSLGWKIVACFALVFVQVAVCCCVHATPTASPARPTPAPAPVLSLLMSWLTELTSCFCFGMLCHPTRCHFQAISC